MKIILKIITLSLFIFSANFVFGQEDNSPEEEDISEESEYDKFRNDSLWHLTLLLEHNIDSMVNIIDSKHKLSKKNIEITSEMDTLIGEQITKIEKQNFKKLCKFSFKTNKISKDLNVNSIDFYFFNDTLIKVKIVCDLTNKNYIDNYYFKNNDCLTYSLFGGRCRGFSIEDSENKKIVFMETAKKLMLKKH